MARPRTPIGGHGSISARRLSATSWQAQTRVRDPDGRTRPVRARAATEAKARSALMTKLANRATTTGNVLSADSSLRAAAQGWLGELERSHRAAGTIERYQAALDQHILPGIGDLAVREITPGSVTRFLRSLTGNRKMVRTVLSHVMKHAVLEGAAPFNPVLHAAPLSEIESSRDKPKPRALKPHELAAVRDAVRAWEASSGRTRSIPLRDIITLQLASGLRISELLALSWSAVDFETSLLRVDATLTMPRGGIQRTVTKTVAGERLIRLPMVAMQTLRRRREDPRFASGPDDPVFASARGGWMWPHNARRAWREARELSDIDLSFVKFHTFRKSAGTAVIDTHGVLAGSRLLGHATTTITETAYYDRRNTVTDVSVVLDELLAEW